MPRGHYRPLDRDRHFVIGWGADQAGSYAAARALEPVMPTVNVISKTQHGVRDLRIGAQLVGSRSCAERPKQVGITSVIALIAGGTGLVLGFLTLRGALRDMHDMVE